MTKENIVLIDYDNDVYFDEEELMYSGIKYYMDNERIEIDGLVNFIQEFYEATGLEGGGTVEEIFKKGLHAVPNDSLQDILTEFEDYMGEEYPTAEALIEDGLYLDLVDGLESQLTNSELSSLVIAIAKENNFSTGVVGYSQWARYVAHDDTSIDYVRAIWDGTDFYTISILSGEGDFDDSIGWVYADSLDSLIEYTKEQFNIKSFRVVNNEIGRYMDLPKVEEHTKTTYSYTNID